MVCNLIDNHIYIDDISSVNLYLQCAPHHNNALQDCTPRKTASQYTSIGRIRSTTSFRTHVYPSASTDFNTALCEIMPMNIMYV